MAKKRREEGKGISRRDFVKSGAAALGAGAAGLDFAVVPSSAAAAGVPVAETYHTTCPYCSASCGQLVDVDAVDTGNVLDVYGDHQSPFNDGGLCAKGAGTFQLVTNSRRIGAWTGPHPVNNVFAADGTSNPVAYKRTGNGAWSAMTLNAALAEIAPAMKSARDDQGGVGASAPTAANGYNSKSVAFFGSSHLNNEPNVAYRRLVAQFGTSNVEHQARI